MNTTDELTIPPPFVHLPTPAIPSFVESPGAIHLDNNYTAAALQTNSQKKIV